MPGCGLTESARLPRCRRPASWLLSDRALLPATEERQKNWYPRGLAFNCSLVYYTAIWSPSDQRCLSAPQSTRALLKTQLAAQKFIRNGSARDLWTRTTVICMHRLRGVTRNMVEFYEYSRWTDEWLCGCGFGACGSNSGKIRSHANFFINRTSNSCVFKGVCTEPSGRPGRLI